MWNEDFNSTFNGGGGFSSSTQSGPAAAPRRPDQHLVAVTAAMIHEQLPQSEVVMIGAYEFSRLKLVGVIRKVQRETMYVMYDVDDGTGPPVKVRQWSDSETVTPTIAEDNYVVVIGHLRRFDQQTYLNAMHIRSINDLNELTVHMLEVIYARKFYQKDILRSRQDKATGVSSNVFAATSGGTAPMLGARGGVEAMDTSDVQSGLKGIESDVYQMVKRCKDDAGIGIGELVRRFTPRENEHTLRRILDHLCSEGFIYSTTDDDHFRVTDS